MPLAILLGDGPERNDSTWRFSPKTRIEILCYMSEHETWTMANGRGSLERPARQFLHDERYRPAGNAGLREIYTLASSLTGARRLCRDI